MSESQTPDPLEERLSQNQLKGRPPSWTGLGQWSNLSGRVSDSGIFGDFTKVLVLDDRAYI